MALNRWWKVCLLLSACGGGGDGGDGTASNAPGGDDGAGGGGPAFAWAKTFSGTTYDVAIDPSMGDVVATGRFSGPADFGGGELVGDVLGSGFVASWTAAGEHRWSQAINAGGWERGFSVAVDDQGDVYVVGVYSKPLDLGAGALPDPDDDSPGLFLASWDRQGVHRWSHGFVAFGGGARFSEHGGFELALDGGGDLYVVGDYQGSADLGGGALAPVGSHYTSMLASFTPDGVHRWSRSLSSPEDPKSVGERYGLAGRADGVCVSGAMGLPTDFGGGLLPLVAEEGAQFGTRDIFLACYDAAGGHVWSKKFGAQGRGWGHGLAADPGGGLVMTGWNMREADFGGGPFDDALFVASFDASGTHRWSAGYEILIAQGDAITLGADGAPILAGHGASDFDFGPHEADGSFALAGFDPASGEPQWARGFGDGPVIGSARSVVADGAGRLYTGGGVTASRAAELDLGGGPVAFEEFTSLGFIAAYDE